MLEELIAQASRERSQATVARRDRPSQRRCEEWSGARPLMRVRAKAMELRAPTAPGGTRAFHGIASATNQGYVMYDMFGPYTEMVASGSFGKTLTQPDLDVPLVLAHDSLRRIARTTNGSLQLAETDEGLDVNAPDLDPNDADVAYIAPKMDAGLIDEMSFRFMITMGEWSPDFTQFVINEVDLDRGDVAIVGYGANPATSGQLRAAGGLLKRATTDDLLAELNLRGATAPTTRGLTQADLALL